MTIREFIEMYEKNPRIDLEKQLEVKKYIGIEQKRLMSKLILDNCTYVVNDEVRIDSVERYLLFIIVVISMHTNLEFTYDENGDIANAIGDYDMLCEAGLIVKIIELFKDDYASCQEILNMMTADKFQNSVTIEQKIGKFLDGLKTILENATNNLVDKVNLDNIVGDLPLDQSKLVDFYNLIKEK